MPLILGSGHFLEVQRWLCLSLLCNQLHNVGMMGIRSTQGLTASLWARPGGLVAGPLASRWAPRFRIRASEKPLLIRSHIRISFT